MQQYLGDPRETQEALLYGHIESLNREIERLHKIEIAAKRVIKDRGSEHEQCGCDEISDCDIACLRDALKAG